MTAQSNTFTPQEKKVLPLFRKEGDGRKSSRFAATFQSGTHKRKEAVLSGEGVTGNGKALKRSLLPPSRRGAL